MPPKVEGYRFGEIVIDGTVYQRDVIVFPERVRPNWWRQQGHSLAPEDLEEVVQARPEIVVIGQGSAGCMQVPEATRRWLEEQGIQVIAQPTAEAVETYNRLCEHHRVVGAFHLTC